MKPEEVAAALESIAQAIRAGEITLTDYDVEGVTQLMPTGGSWAQLQMVGHRVTLAYRLPKPEVMQ
jgi:hypothetical protein